MKQPELGKKIAELRKAKSLTQEELVEKCNLNVRTLQRIETGSVSPRIYTIKTIFAALEYPINNSSEIKFHKTGSVIFYWLEQFYRYFLDLFNLKTNTMKKITILSIMLSSIILGIFILTQESKAQKENKGESQVSVKSSQTQLSDKGMVFSNFSCDGCFEENDEMIGRDVKFKNNGVAVNLRLLKLNKKTREFNAGFIKGKFLKNRVELICPQDILNDGYAKYTADKVEQSDGKILLKGNAKITSSQNETIEADEIDIATN